MFLLLAQLKNEDGVPEDEENFDEAIAAVNTAFASNEIPSQIKEILENEKCVNLNPKSSDFWVMCRALKEFSETDGKGELPLSGRIPDMFSDSERYVQLQNVYRDKAAVDAENVYRRVQGLLEQLGRSAVSVTHLNLKL